MAMDTKEVPLERTALALVYTECDTKIYFEPATAVFSAEVGPDRDKSLLHSRSFSEVVQRIRERMLIEPIDGALVSIRQVGYASPRGTRTVKVERVKVVEYHKGRQHPFVFRGAETDAPWSRSTTADTIYQPRELDLATFQEIVEDWDTEDQRHADETAALRERLKVAYAATPQITTRNIRFLAAQAVEAAKDEHPNESDIQPA